MKERKYFHSQISHAVLDIKSRRQKASAIISILKLYKNLKTCAILDIGTGSGVISHELGKACKKAYSVDIRDERVVKDKFLFKKINDEKLPFNDETFDIVVSNHVMAHVKHGELHLEEISRVLKPDGIAYVSMLNRLCLLEPNFQLPLLSFFPKKIADSYVKLTGRGKSYDVNPLTYNGFAKKISVHFDYDDVTITLIRQKIWMPYNIYDLVKVFSPVWIFIARKR